MLSLNKRQINKLEKMLHLVGDLFELYDDAHTNFKFSLNELCLKVIVNYDFTKARV